MPSPISVWQIKEKALDPAMAEIIDKVADGLNEPQGKTQVIAEKARDTEEDRKR